MTPQRPQTTQKAVLSSQLPALYNQRKWRILLAYAGFYLFQYLGRFHLSQVTPLVMQDLAIDHHTLGWITALLYWGFMAGDMVLLSAAVSALALMGIALLPPTQVYTGATLLFIGSFAMSLLPMAAIAVDIAGRHMAGTASGLLNAHGYFYAGLQSAVFGVLLNMSGSPWPLVFLLMAGTRVLCGILIFFMKA